MARIIGTDLGNSILPTGSSAGVVGGASTENGDLIFGLEGSDIVDGGAGNDTIDGAAGDDTLTGGGGDDVLTFRPYYAVAVQEGGAGNDDLSGSRTAFIEQVDNRPYSFDSEFFLWGGTGSDTIRGFNNPHNIAWYFNESGPVIANLGTGTATSPDGADILVGVRAITGSDFNDQITGSSGDDVIWYSPGVDALNGGAGANDLLKVGGFGAITASLAAGTYTATDGSGTLSGIEHLIGSFQPDRLTGDAQANRLSGLGAADTLIGGGGDDILLGGDAQDSLSGGGGQDRFVFQIYGIGSQYDSSLALPDIITDYSGAELDLIEFQGNTLAAVYYAGNSGLTLSGLTLGTVLPAATVPAGYNGSVARFIASTNGGGWLLVDIGPGTGTISSNDFAIRLAGSVTAADIRIAGDVAATQVGTAGGDVLHSSGPASGLLGLAGNDTLYGGLGVHSLMGDAGDDQVVIRSLDTSAYEDPDGGYDVAWLDVDGYSMSNNFEEIRLIGTAASVRGGDYGEAIVANAGRASVLAGMDGNDTLWGGAFADTLEGGTGDDIIRGQGGADVMIGGEGNDQYVITGAGTQVIEYFGEGVDTVWIAVNNFTLSDNIEIARLSAPGAVSLTGSSGADQLVANQGAGSALQGMGGDDTLWGSSLADTLDGGDGDDIIRGQGGADVVIGGTGNDQYVLFNAAATVQEAAQGGYDIVYMGGAGSFTIGDNVEEARLTDAGNELIGNALTNVLVGNNAGLASKLNGGAGDDYLFGTAAADTLIGGAGNDTIYSYGGADRLVYQAAGWGTDQVGGLSTAAGAKIVFNPSSGVMDFGQLAINSAGGNTQITVGNDIILLFGVSTVSASDFIFG